MLSSCSRVSVVRGGGFLRSRVLRGSLPNRRPHLSHKIPFVDPAVKTFADRNLESLNLGFVLSRSLLQLRVVFLYFL